MKLLIDLYKGISRRHFSTLSGSIAFFFIVNGGSILFLSLILFNYFDINLNMQFNNNGNYITKIFEYMYKTAHSLSNSYSIFFLITSFWSSSTLFFHLLKIGEILYEIKRKKFGVISRIGAIILVLIFLALLTSMMVLFVIIMYLTKFINDAIIFYLTQFFLFFIIPFIIIIFFNIFVPPIRVPFKQSLYGSVITLLIWIIVTLGLSIYLKIFVNFKIIYGAIAFVIIFMIWIYLLCQGLVIGLIINYENWLKLKEYESLILK